MVRRVPNFILHKDLFADFGVANTATTLAWHLLDDLGYLHTCSAHWAPMSPVHESPPLPTRRRDESLNTITRLYDSGKSNILNAIGFVLGITHTNGSSVEGTRVSIRSPISTVVESQAFSMRSVSSIRSPVSTELESQKPSMQSFSPSELQTCRRFERTGDEGCYSPTAVESQTLM